MKNQEAARLWFSGEMKGNISHPILMKEAAIDLGVPPARIITYMDVHNTRTEMKALKANTAYGDNIVIVSSSYHLPRVALWAKHYGLFPLYAPADTFPKFKASETNLFKFLIPQESALILSSTALHEYLGIAHWFLLTQLQLSDE